MLIAVLLGFLLALLALAALRLTPAARAVSADRWFRNLAGIATAFALGAAVAVLMAGIFGSGMLAEDRDSPGAALPTNVLVMGMVAATVAAGALFGCRHFAMRHKRFRRLLRGRSRNDPRSW